MATKKVLLIIPTTLVMLLGIVSVIIACVGSPQPPVCPTSIFLGKFVTETMVAPTEASIVPTGLFPYVTWATDTEDCPSPNFASVTLRYLCTPEDGSTPLVIGPQMFTLDTPTVPGPQPLGGTTAPFEVPAGTPPSVCLIEGTYDVTFSLPTGGIGLLSATGDAEAYFVESSPDDPSMPLVSMEVLTVDDGEEEGAFSAHQGDQQLYYLVLENNDPSRSATFNIEGDIIQAAGFADGFTTAEDAYTDPTLPNFNPANPDDVFSTTLFTGMDPTPGPQAIRPGVSKGDPQGPTEITLGPGEIGVVGVAQRIFGACANGSCDENKFRAEITMEDAGKGMQEVYHVGASFVVNTDNHQAPTFPGLTLDDLIKMAAIFDAFWSSLEIRTGDGEMIDETHGTNVLEGERPDPKLGIRTAGSDIAGTIWSDTWWDRVTIDETEFEIMDETGFDLSARWEVLGGYADDAFAVRHTMTEIDGLNPTLGDCLFPTITSTKSNDRITVKADVSGGCNDNAFVQIDGAAMGTIGDLRTNPDYRIDDASCRTLSFPWSNNLDAPYLVADPPFMAFNVDDPAAFITFVDITDQLGNSADWELTVEGADAVTALTPEGNGQATIEVDPTGLAPGQEIRATLVFTNPNAINNPLRVPLLVRRRSLQVLPLPDFDLGFPPLGQVGQPYNGNLVFPPLGVSSGPQYLNMEAVMNIKTEDSIDLEAAYTTQPGQPLLRIIDSNTPDEEVDRLREKFGEESINRCRDEDQKCGVIAFGDGFEFEAEISITGFEGGYVGVLNISAAADNSQRKDKQQPIGVLDESNALIVSTEDELKTAIALFNTASFISPPVSAPSVLAIDFKPSGTLRVTKPLEPIVVDVNILTFDDGAKNGTNEQATLDGSQCPAPCSGLVLAGGNSSVNGIRFEGFPDYGLVLEADSNTVALSAFAGNGAGGVLIKGSDNLIGGLEEAANVFEANDGPGIIVESGVRNRLLFNTFPGHDRTAIDLGGDSLTPNDDGDGDTGPNTLQNFPVLTNVLPGGSITIQGTLDSTPNTPFTLQFFSSGDTTTRANEIFLGEAEVTTDASGGAPFDVVVDGTAAIGSVVTATATDADGNTSEFSPFFAVTTGVATEDEPGVPTRYTLFQNYPNPFNPVTTIRYDVPQASRVRLAVYDVLGRRVAVLADEQKAPGSYTVVFDARGLPSGTYIYRMTGNGFAQTRRLVLLK